MLMVFPAALGQRPGAHQPRLHTTGAHLQPEAGVRQPALRTVEGNGGAGHQDAEGATPTPASFHEPSACRTSDC